MIAFFFAQCVYMVHSVYHFYMIRITDTENGSSLMGNTQMDVRERRGKKSHFTICEKLVRCKNRKQSPSTHTNVLSVRFPNILPKIGVYQTSQRAGVKDLELCTEPIYTRINIFLQYERWKILKNVHSFVFIKFDG